MRTLRIPAPRPARAARLAVLALAAVVVAACGGSAATPTTPSPSTPPTQPPTQVPGGGDALAGKIDGHTYLGVKVTGHTLADVTLLRLGFKGGTLSGSGGCNSFSGPFTLIGGVLGVNAMGMTEMACEQARMAQDDWFSSILAGATITLDGDHLALVNGAVTVEMTDQTTVNPAKPLEGTRWVLDTIIGAGGTASSVPADVTASITIKGGQAEIEFGCNGGGGPVTVGAGTLVFGPLISTKMACAGARAEVEGITSAVFEGEVTYAIDGSHLTIMHGDQGLGFTAEG